MISVDDFTALPTEVLVPEGVVALCPRCGRAGAAGPAEGGGFLVVHVQASEIFADGLLVEPLDCCRIDD